MPRATTGPGRSTSPRKYTGLSCTLPSRTPAPPVWVESLVPPEWGQTRPTGSCHVDVDLDVNGNVLQSRWASGEIEVSNQVFEALKQWKFYPVVVRGEPAAVRVRLSMCDY